MPQTKHTSGEKRNCENLGKLTKGKSPCFNLDTRWYLVDTRAEIYPRISQKIKVKMVELGSYITLQVNNILVLHVVVVNICNTTICVNGRKKAYAMS